MEQISNARKAREIAENAHSSSFFSIEDCETFDVKLLGKTVKRRDIDSLKPEIRRAIKYGAITMGEWKDKQIDSIMLTTEGCLRSFFESQGNTQESIDNFIDALKTQIKENLKKL